jgi:type III pantothenate kinase
MLLAIDIGNTNIVFGINENGNWLKDWRIQTDPLKMADEYRVIFSHLLLDADISLNQIHEVIISSVVPSLVYPFTEMLSQLLKESRIVNLNPDYYQKLPIKILNPYEIGTDLVANAVAAFEKYGKYTMIIDFGTALTFTTIGGDSEIRGVAIAPGLNTAVIALAGKTAQLPQIHLSVPPSVLGENTIHAIQSGVVYGFAGLVDSIIDRTQNELKKKLNIVATGGLSNVIAPLTKNVKIIEPMLTLVGLNLVNAYIKK